MKFPTLKCYTHVSHHFLFHICKDQLMRFKRIIGSLWEHKVGNNANIVFVKNSIIGLIENNRQWE